MNELKQKSECMVVSKLKLNLGRFNECVDYLVDGQNADYPVDPGQEVFYYMSRNGDIVSTKRNVDCVNIPLFDIDAYIDGPSTTEQFLSYIEFEVFAMIRKILQKSGGNFKLKNIHIPIGISVSDECIDGGRFVCERIGIAVIV